MFPGWRRRQKSVLRLSICAAILPKTIQSLLWNKGAAAWQETENKKGRIICLFCNDDSLSKAVI